MENNLGKLGKDKVTGFKGIIVAYAKHLTGCDTYLLVAQVAKDNRRSDNDSYWVDVGRVDILGSGIQLKEVKGNKNGGMSLPSVATKL